MNREQEVRVKAVETLRMKLIAKFEMFSVCEYVSQYML